MDDHPVNRKWKTYKDDDNLQKPNIYIKYLPFHESIKRHRSESFNEIRENLSRAVQLSDLDSGFTVWSNALDLFISTYGFYFTKTDHLKLINLYMSILSIVDLNYLYVENCFDMLYKLMWFVFTLILCSCKKIGQHFKILW